MRCPHLLSIAYHALTIWPTLIYILLRMNIPMLLLMLILIGAGNGYALWHIWHLLPLPMVGRWIVTMCFAVVAFSQWAFFLLNGTEWPLSIASFFYKVGNSWLFIMVYLVLIFLLLDLGRWVGLVPTSFLKSSWIGTGSIASLMLALFAYANYHFHDKQRVALHIETSKPLTRPVKVVMLSDIHAGFHIRRNEIAQMVDRINAEHPDYVLIAGDIIDISVRPLLEEGTANEFRRIEAPTYAILGNHEYHSGNPQALKFLRDADIRLLQDSLVNLPEGITIVGRDDRSNPHRKNLRVLTKDLSPERFTILLDHQPYHLEQAEQAGIDFQFSGHTHRGQIWPFSWVTDRLYETAWGHHQRGKTQYYVSSGYGIWGGKFRLVTQSEYLVLRLSPSL